VVSSSTPLDPPASYGPVQPVPEWLDEILNAVLRDLQHPQAVELRFGWTPPEGERPGTLWFEEVGHQGLTGVHVVATDMAYLTVLLADAVQGLFFETSAAYGQSRPACPGHPHPADADLRDSAAWWICPTDKRPLWPVGAACYR
jgi:hypothetical protein